MTQTTAVAKCGLSAEPARSTSRCGSAQLSSVLESFRAQVAGEEHIHLPTPSLCLIEMQSGGSGKRVTTPARL